MTDSLASKSTGWASMKDWLPMEFGFRTGPNDSVINVVLMRHKFEIFWDAVSLVEDDSVKIGDLSPAVHAVPTLNQEEQDRGFLTFTRPMEENTNARYVPTREECSMEVKAFSSRGEYETLLVMAHALKDLPQVGVQWIQRPKLRDKELSDVELFRIGYTHCSLSSQSYIRYPLLLLPPTVNNVPCGDVAQWAIRAKVPSDATPGKYVGMLAITVAGQPKAQVEVGIEVPPFTLDNADVSFFMYYPDDTIPQDMATRAMQEKYYRDMAAHGMNSVTLYADPEKEDNGRFTIDLDHDYRYKPDDPRHQLGIRQRLAQMKAPDLCRPSGRWCF